MSSTGARSAVRERMMAASGRIARLKRIDRAAVGFITLGGIAVIVAVAGILVFIAAEALPLFRPASVTPAASIAVVTRAASAAAPGLEAFGVDEYRKSLYTVEPDARVVFHLIDTGAKAREAPLASLADATITATSRSLIGHFVAAATGDGRVALLQVRFTPQYDSVKASLKNLWGGWPEAEPLTADQMMVGMKKEEINGCLVIGANPVMLYPDREFAHDALEGLDFLVVE